MKRFGSQNKPGIEWYAADKGGRSANAVFSVEKKRGMILGDSQAEAENH